MNCFTKTILIVFVELVEKKEIYVYLYKVLTFL